MKITESKTRIILDTKYFCDICGESIDYDNRCYICQKNVCTKCRIETDTNHLKDNCCSSDYPDYFCKNCWFIGKEFIENIKKIRLDAEDKEEEQWGLWLKQSKNILL